MDKFNYALYFDREQIFSVDDKESIKEFNKALKDISKIEEYFSLKFPNMEKVRPIIALSYKFNKDLNYKDRINYITGIIYCTKYIKIEDVYTFIDNLPSGDYIEGKSMFFNKGYENNDNGFFVNAFDSKPLNYFETSELLKKADEELFNEGLLIDFDEDILISIEDIDDEDEDEDEDEEYFEYENNETYNNVFYEITPREKLNLFKENFEEFINIMLYRKCVEERKNNRRRRFIINGMRDYFNYVMNIMESAYEIDKKQKSYKSDDLSEFL